MTPTTKTEDKARTATLDVDAVDVANLPAVPDAAVPAPVNFTEDEWAGVADGDLAPPDETLLPLLDMDRKNGEGVVDPSTGERVTNLEFIWLARSASRAWWEKSFDDRDGNDSPDCRSADAVTGVGAFGPDSDSNPTGKCAACPMSKWDADKPPPCKQSIEAMIAIPDTAGKGAALFRLRFGGLSFAPSRAYWDSFRARVPRIPAIGFITEMLLEAKQTDNGKFLVPRFTRVAQLRREHVEPLIVERDRLIDEFKRLVEQDVATLRQEGDEDVRTVHATEGAAAQHAPDEEPF